jgi:hypothetical protein
MATKPELQKISYGSCLDQNDDHSFGTIVTRRSTALSNSDSGDAMEKRMCFSALEPKATPGVAAMPA